MLARFLCELINWHIHSEEETILLVLLLVFLHTFHNRTILTNCHHLLRRYAYGVWPYIIWKCKPQKIKHIKYLIFHCFFLPSHIHPKREREAINLNSFPLIARINAHVLILEPYKIDLKSLICNRSESMNA